MRFRRWVVFTFIVHVLVVLLDKGAGLILFKLLEDQPEVKGAVDMLTALPFIMMSIANLGLATSSVFYLRRREVGTQTVATTNGTVALLWGSTVAGLAILASQTVLPRLAPDWDFDPGYVVPIALCVPLLLTSSYFNCIQLATDRIRDYNFIHLLGSLTFLPLFFLFYWLTGQQATYAMALGRFVSAAAVAIATVWLLRRVVRWRIGIDWQFLKRGLRYGWKANLTSVFTYLNHRVDLYLVGFLFLAVGAASHGERRDIVLAQVGFYSFAVSFAELVWHFPEATRDLFFSKVAGSTHEEARRFTPVMCRLCLFAALLGSVLIYFAVDPAMSVLSPDRWGPVWAPNVLACLAVLIPGTAFYTVAKILQNDLAARGHLNHCLIACLLVFGTMVGLDFLWIPNHGALGAAWASSIAYGVSSVYSLFAYRLTGGGAILDCLAPRRGDFEYLRELWRAVREKLRGRPA